MGSILMGFAHGGHQQTVAAASQRNAVLALKDRGVLAGCVDLYTYRADYNRNKIVEKLLAMPADCTWLGMLDDDVIPHKDALVKQWERAELSGADVFCALVFQGNGYPNVFNVHVGLAVAEYGRMTPSFEFALNPVYGWLEEFSMWDKTPPWCMDQSSETSLLQIAAAGTAGMFIHRRLLERMTPPWFNFEYGSSEDVYFCDKARVFNPRMLVDLSICHGHLREKCVGPRAFKQVVDKLNQEDENS